MQRNIYMVSGAGGNITLQIGTVGVLIVDTEFAPLVPKILVEIRKLSHIGGGLGGLMPRGPAQTQRTLEVRTSQLLAGYLRKNGVPYSEKGTVTEYYDS